MIKTIKRRLLSVKLNKDKDLNEKGKIKSTSFHMRISNIHGVPLIICLDRAAV